MSKPRRGMGRRLAAALALCAIVVAVPAAALGAGAQQRSRGPLALSRVAIGQHKLHGRITLSVESRLPPLRKLKRYPEAIRARGRHLCVAIDGHAANHRLLCLGGRVNRGLVHVGISRYFRNGRARKLHGFRAHLRRRSDRSIQLRFPLRDADLEHGRFRFFAASAWVGAACDPPARARKGRRRAARHRGRTARASACYDRLPARGAFRGRIYKVERVGCTSGRSGAFFNGPTDRKRIALTFDDGPSSYTGQILRSLDRLHAKGTFFEVGNQTGGDSKLMRRIIKHGHEIGNHSWAHEQYPGSASMAQTNRAIVSATGFTPCHFRPPYGAYNSGTIDAARHNGMSVTLWNVDTQDYRQPGWGVIYSRAVQAGRGAIVLMHDGGGNRSQTVEAVPHIVKELRSRGYELVTVTELVGGHFKLREKR